MNPYADSLEHLHDELRRLDLLIRRAMLMVRETQPTTENDHLQGLVISESDIDSILRAKDFWGAWWQTQESQNAALAPLDHQLDALRQEIDQRRQLSDEAEIHLSLPYLARCFNLSQAEVDLILIALAPEIELRYETLYAYLQNDVTRKRPSINLALNLICRSEQEKLDARGLFGPSAPLVQYHLLERHDESQDRHPSFLRQFLKLDGSLVDFLLDHPPSLEGLWFPSRQQAGQPTIDAFPSLRNLADYCRQRGAQQIVLRLVGSSDATLKQAAEQFGQSLGRNLLHMKFDASQYDESQMAQRQRDAIVWNALLTISADETPMELEGHGSTLKAESLLWQHLSTFQEPILLLGPSSAFTRVPHHIPLWQLDIPSPSFAQRQGLWEQVLEGRTNEIDVARLADALPFGTERIRQTLNLASGMAASVDPAEVSPSTQQLLAAGRALTTPHVGRYALRVEPRYTWSDLVLPPDKLAQLRHIASWLIHRRVVHTQWGFGAKLSRGKGLNVLFSGPSGTGKTMAAEVLAREFALELFQIDLSSVVSKYIGETEKNLSAIFREAEHCQALLFFDEADALFGKRTEVKDAHDRYANIEVNYLLQRIEQYEGVVILATNLQRNLDDAFVRRMQDIVEFPFPDETLRERIWRTHFPAEAPQGDDIDFGFLAKQFKLPGGHIKNIVLYAAFLAARESPSVIRMEHLIQATNAEFQKQGKISVKSDFGRYYELVRKELVR